MKIGALHIYPWRVVWHWKWSLTWRWIFSISRHDKTVQMGFHKLPTHQGECVLIVWNTRAVDFAFRSQPNMLHYKVRDANVDKWLMDAVKKG